MKRAVLLVATLSIALSAHALRPDWDVTLKAGQSTQRMYAADLNLDGRPDLVSRNSIHQVLVSLTAANGTFGTWTVAHAGTYVTHLQVGDFDEDGDADVAIADTVLNAITVLPSNGDGTFGTPVVSTLTFSPTELEVGDFNNDDHLDLAARSYSASYLVVLAGNGAGSFAEVSRRSLALSGFRSAAGDVDGDGHLDVVIAHQNPAFYEIHYGLGNGTFEGAVTTDSGSEPLSEFVIADVDKDGAAELISTEFVPSTVTVVRNFGGRILGPAETYQPLPTSYEYGSAFDVVAADFNGDTHVDLAVTLTNNRTLAVLPGNSSGTFGDAALKFVTPVLPIWMTTGDFTGDGKLDIATSSSSHGIVLFAQNPGQVEVYVTAETPTISHGQTAKLSVGVRHASASFDTAWFPDATGTVTVKNGTTTLGTQFVHSGYALTFELASLPVGTHNLTVEYGGDENYRPTVSDVVMQKVVAEASVTVLSSTTEEVVPYGSQIPLVADVTSPVNAPLGGSFYLHTNGVRSEYTSYGPPARWYPFANTIGTYTFQAEYLGNADHPRSTSNVLRRTVRKARTTTSWSAWGNFAVREGHAGNELRVEVSSETGSISGAGTVQIYEGSTLLHTTTPGADFLLPVLAPGTHYLRAVYSGNQYYEGSTSEPFSYTVIGTGSLAIFASRTSSWIEVDGIYNGPANGTPVGSYRCYQRINNGPWTSQTCSGTMDIYSPVAGAVYSFRMEAYNGANQLLAASNVATYVNVTFTDPLLKPGMFMKAVHVQELLNAVNALRGAAGLSPVSLTAFGAGQRIRADHLQTLRTGINDARVALLGSPIAFTAGVASGSPIQLLHVYELRDALQ